MPQNLPFSVNNTGIYNRSSPRNNIYNRMGSFDKNQGIYKYKNRVLVN